ncbi:IclR family transcriptional regulator [Acuticoccus kandeliae]|uniref:IclR family transcriptional regulator n=1 Tax=Acuticoccus kandeliae TaxID=2073160 RepID=UPI000D3EAE44|nr:IclR family transcriptional regulator [Acuticoccus kandeliae]
MGAPKSTETDGSVRSVERAARLIKLLAAATVEGSRLSDLAVATGLGKSTAHRILSALADQGFVYRNPADRRYFLGYELVRLARVDTMNEITHLAAASLDRLADETGDVVFLQVREGAFAVCLARRVGNFPIKTLTLNVGDRRPLGVGAGSLALLSFLPDAEVDAIVADTTRTVTYPQYPATTMRALVERTRQAGFSLNEGRIVTGMGAVGVPVVAPDGRLLAALSIAAIEERIVGERMAWIVELLKREAEAIAALAAISRTPAATA